MMGGGGEKLAQKHCCRVVVNGYHPCSGLGATMANEVILDNERLYSAGSTR